MQVSKIINGRERMRAEPQPEERLSGLTHLHFQAALSLSYKYLFFSLKHNIEAIKASKLFGCKHQTVKEQPEMRLELAWYKEI